MPDRTRPIRKEICLNEQELNLIQHKMTLTAREAAEYSNIGINKIDSMLRAPNCPSFCSSGRKSLSNGRNLRTISTKSW